MAEERAPAVRVPGDVLVHLRRARDHIDRDYAEPLDLEAHRRGRPGLSKWHFHRLFRRPTGSRRRRTSPSAGSSAPRTCCAPTNLTVTEVCHAVGFTSLGSFSSRFRDDRRREPARVPAALGCRRAADPGLLGVHVGTGRAQARKPGEAQASAVRSRLASSHDHEHFPGHASSSRTSTRRSASTSTSSASTRARTSLSATTAGAPCVHPEPARAPGAPRHPRPAALPGDGRVDQPRPRRGRHARPRSRRRRLPQDRRRPEVQGRAVPPGPGGAAVRRRGPDPRQLRQLDGARRAQGVHPADFDS